MPTSGVSERGYKLQTDGLTPFRPLIKENWVKRENPILEAEVEMNHIPRKERGGNTNPIANVISLKHTEKEK